jgi:hypothetical protein
MGKSLNQMYIQIMKINGLQLYIHKHIAESRMYVYIDTEEYVW